MYAREHTLLTPACYARFNHVLRGIQMRKFLVTIALLAASASPSFANASVNISFVLVQYPTLQRIPGYPVYYAPGLHANYFFYDGLYWVYIDDAWYASPWYNGPWDLVAIDSVPLFILRVPVRYYGYPPTIFSQWVVNAPPRWDRVWGPGWARRHHNWQQWNRAAAPRPAPLPRYQARYTQENYPNDVQRRQLVRQHYSYAPRDAQVRQRWQPRSGPAQAPLAQQATQRDVRASHPRPVERAETDMNRRPPARDVQAPRFEHPPHVTQARPEARPEPREFVRSEQPDRGGRPDRPHKAEKDEGHGPGKHH